MNVSPPCYRMAMSNMKRVLEAVFAVAYNHDIDISDDTIMLALADAYVTGAIAHAKDVRQVLNGGK